MAKFKYNFIITIQIVISSITLKMGNTETKSADNTCPYRPYHSNCHYGYDMYKYTLGKLIEKQVVVEISVCEIAAASELGYSIALEKGKIIAIYQQGAVRRVESIEQELKDLKMLVMNEFKGMKESINKLTKLIEDEQYRRVAFIEMEDFEHSINFHEE